MAEGPSLFGAFFEGITGVTVADAKQWALKQAKAKFRHFICRCGHLNTQHEPPPEMKPGEGFCGGMFNTRGAGGCGGMTNGKPCNCTEFHSLADRDEEARKRAGENVP